MDKVPPEPYVDPNFGTPPVWIIDVHLKKWRDLSPLQKELMIQERVMNARTTEELNLAHNLIKIENNLNKTKNKNSYYSGNKGMR